MSAVHARCIRRFLYTLSRVEISVYAVYPDTCGRSYRYIFVYADVTVSEPVFFRGYFPKWRRAETLCVQCFLCNAHALLTNPLRCPDRNRIRVDGRIRFVYADIFVSALQNLQLQKSPDTCGRGIIEYLPYLFPALSPTLLRFFWTTFLETAVYYSQTPTQKRKQVIRVK